MIPTCMNFKMKQGKRIKKGRKLRKESLEKEIEKYLIEKRKLKKCEKKKKENSKELIVEEMETRKEMSEVLENVG